MNKQRHKIEEKKRVEKKKIEEGKKCTDITNQLDYRYAKDTTLKRK